MLVQLTKSDQLFLSAEMVASDDKKFGITSLPPKHAIRSYQKMGLGCFAGAKCGSAVEQSLINVRYPRLKFLNGRIRNGGSSPIIFMTWGRRDGLAQFDIDDNLSMQEQLGWVIRKLPSNWTSWSHLPERQGRPSGKDSPN